MRATIFIFLKERWKRRVKIDNRGGNSKIPKKLFCPKLIFFLVTCIYGSN